MRMWRAMASRIETHLVREMEVLPTWLPVMLGGGIAAWFALPGPGWWAAFILSGLGLAAVAWRRRARGSVLAHCVAIGGLAIAAGCALIWLRAATVAAPVLDRPVVASFNGWIIDTDPLPARGQLRLLVATVDGDALPPRIRVTLPYTAEDVARLQPGGGVAMRARLMPPPRAALPGGYDFARRAWFERIGAVGSAIGPVTGGATAHGERGVRDRLTTHIRSRVAGSAGGVAAAFVTGDRGGIAPADDAAMRAAGLAHLLSISGLHVTAAVGGAMWLSLRLLLLWPGLGLRLRLPVIAAGFGAAAGIGYTLLSGAEVPTIRSTIAALLVLAALLIGREALTMRLVAAGALIVLLLWPESLINPSFQMSFAAVTAIVALHSQPHVTALLARRDEGLAARLMRGVVGLVLTGLAVECTLMPIALFHFHKAGLYGALANVVAIPLTTFVIMPAEALGLALDSVGVGAPAWWVAQTGLDAMLWLAHLVAAAPGAVAAFPSMPTAAFGLAIAGGLWLLLWRTPKRWFGAVPIIAGMAWAISVAPPDLLITSDGRHVASRLPDGRYALLRGRSGSFVRDQIAEAAGIVLPLAARGPQERGAGRAAGRALGEGTGRTGAMTGAITGLRRGAATNEEAMLSISRMATAECNRDFCRWTTPPDPSAPGAPPLTILASTSRDLSDWRSLIAACVAADIVIADRRLPAACTPRWFVADRPRLAVWGGLAVDLRGRRITAANAASTGKPWANPPTVGPPPRPHKRAKRQFRPR